MLSSSHQKIVFEEQYFLAWKQWIDFFDKFYQKNKRIDPPDINKFQGLVKFACGVVLSGINKQDNCAFSLDCKKNARDFLKEGLQFFTGKIVNLDPVQIKNDDNKLKEIAETIQEIEFASRRLKAVLQEKSLSFRQRFARQYKSMNVGWKILAGISFVLGIAAVVVGAFFCPPALIFIGFGVKSWLIAGGTGLAGATLAGHTAHIALSKNKKNKIDDQAAMPSVVNSSRPIPISSSSTIASRFGVPSLSRSDRNSSKKGNARFSSSFLPPELLDTNIPPISGVAVFKMDMGIRFNHLPAKAILSHHFVLDLLVMSRIPREGTYNENGRIAFDSAFSFGRAT